MCMQVSIAALTFVFGFVTVIGSYVMMNLEKTRALQRVLVHFFRLMPPFLLGEGLIELTKYHFEHSMELARQNAALAGSPANSTTPAAPPPPPSGKRSFFLSVSLRPSLSPLSLSLSPCVSLSLCVSLPLCLCVVRATWQEFLPHSLAPCPTPNTMTSVVETPLLPHT
jgi:hypothetical protein